MTTTVSLIKNPAEKVTRFPEEAFDTICELIENGQFATIDPTRPIQVIGTGLSMHCELRRPALLEDDSYDCTDCDSRHESGDCYGI